MRRNDDWWAQGCPKRGPALSHAHSSKCNRVHPDDSSETAGHNHPFYVCCHCEQSQPEPSVQEVVPEEADENIAIDEDKPLALEQPLCGFTHNALIQETPLIGSHGMEWPICPKCKMPVEPKRVNGGPIGPYFGKGRGWVSPRMKNHWSAVAFRAMADDEKSVKPLAPEVVANIAMFWTE